jgi:hypothetical protein
MLVATGEVSKAVTVKGLLFVSARCIVVAVDHADDSAPATDDDGR